MNTKTYNTKRKGFKNSFQDSCETKINRNVSVIVRPMHAHLSELFQINSKSYSFWLTITQNFYTKSEERPKKTETACQLTQPTSHQSIGQHSTHH